MITLLHRYIARHVIYTSLFSASLLTGVLFVVTLLPELKNIGEGEYGMPQALWYTLLHLPGSLYQFSPLIFLLGSVLGLGLLAVRFEIVSMRASGFSTHRIIKSTLITTLLLIAGLAIVGESIAPKMNTIAEANKENERSRGQIMMTDSGVWFHVKYNFVHVDQMINNDYLVGVSRYQFNDHNQMVAVYDAKSLVYQDHQWMMQDGVKTLFEDHHIKSESFKALPWDLPWHMNLLSKGNPDLSEMSLLSLHRSAHYLRHNGLQSFEYQYEFWQRLLMPASTCLMILIALPFILSLQSIKILGFRMFIALFSGTGFFIFNALLKELCVVYQITPILAAFLPLMILGLGYMLLIYQKVN